MNPLDLTYFRLEQIYVSNVFIFILMCTAAITSWQPKFRPPPPHPAKKKLDEKLQTKSQDGTFQRSNIA